MTDNGLTTFQREAKADLERIEERLAEIREEIDPAEVWDPNYDASEREMELAHEYDRLLGNKKDMEKILDEGLP